MRVLLLVAGLLFSVMANAEVRHEKSTPGDFYAYIPNQAPGNILVIARVFHSPRFGNRGEGYGG